MRNKSQPKVVDTSGVIRRTNKFFLQMKSYGHCDENGRVVMGLSGFKKMVAQPDKPLTSLLIPLVELLMEAADYSSEEAMKADVAAARKRVAGWHVVRDSPQQDSGKRSGCEGS